ncbi:30S ribosomal protein S17 [Mollicutes bacterium LVI A0078]|nr:30S ribosomal protein S17 [Mollicutes bacterium LVI A0075]WOO90267.1 30S ribosomal protein S17 [Mollicutes bacterium LVI A0078]
MENTKRSYVGKVVSTKMDKTITVLVETTKAHPVYGKKVTTSKKYHAHDEENIAGMGDVVRIEESRPLSATKRTKLVEIIEKGRE